MPKGALVGVSIDGALCDASDAQVSVFDRGLLYGDTLFETFRYRDDASGNARCELHLERLSKAAQQLKLKVPEALASWLRVAFANTQQDEVVVRITLTRGVCASPLGMPASQAARCIIALYAWQGRDAQRDEQGVAVMTVISPASGIAALDGTKNGNYLRFMMAYAEAKEAGMHDAILIGSAGEVLEGALSNVFVVHQERVLTPPLAVGVLPGITRSQVIQIATRLGYAVQEQMLFPSDMYGAQECFLCNSVQGIVPVVNIDGATIGDGQPGKLTRQLQQLEALSA